MTCVLAALVIAACATLPTDEQVETSTEQFDRQLQALAREGFAGQVLVARGDKVLLLSGYGTMGLDDPLPVTDNAVMPLASVTKPFAASAVFALAAEGRLGLDDPIGDFLEALEPPWSDIPIGALLTHTAGLPAEIRHRDHANGHLFEPVDRETFLERVQQFPPDHPPGDGFNYSNIGYGIVAAVIETAAEQSWEAYLVGSLLNTAGISDIGLELPEWQPPELVRARHDELDLGHWLEQPRLADGMGYNIRGAGDLLARPTGILAWWHAMRREIWLSSPWLELWLEPQVREPDGSQYGFGLHFRNSPLGPVIGHTGAEAGFTVDFSWFTQLDLLVYINSANADFPADELHSLLLAFLAGHSTATGSSR